jgi:hypothetical protein
VSDARAPGPPLDRDEADRTLARLREEKERIGTALLDLEGHPGRQMLDGAALDGETIAPVEAGRRYRVRVELPA